MVANWGDDLLMWGEIDERVGVRYGPLQRKLGLPDFSLRRSGY